MIGLLPGDEQTMDLAAAVDGALGLLGKNPNVFFLMVESNGHFDDPRQTLELVAAFDDLIRRVAAECAEPTRCLSSRPIIHTICGFRLGPGVRWCCASCLNALT